ncbi:MAG: hypothetical protein AB1346_00645 [Thermodesulfobacteriota bacterium]
MRTRSHVPGFGILLLMIFVLSAPSCPPGTPSIDRFFVTYDILCGQDKLGVDWEVTNSTSVTLSVAKKDGGTVFSQAVSSSSKGMHIVDVSAYAPGFYKAVLEATNAQGASTRQAEFLVAGLPGTAGELWYKFNKTVERPKEGPWMAFITTVPVMVGQGQMDADTTIAVSERVYFRQFRWNPNPSKWADREGCTSSGLWRMNIGQYSKIQSGCEKNKNYTFRSDWSVAGDYTCAVSWAPCNFGVKGSMITFTDVEFSLELQAMCKN